MAAHLRTLTLSTLFVNIFLNNAAINLYISNQELQRVLGFDSELYYIRRSEENWNAIHHQLMISEYISHIIFRWQDEQLPSFPSTTLYSAKIYSSSSDVINPPTLSLESSEKVPTQEKEFQINVTCKAKVTGFSTVYLQLNLTTYHSKQVKGRLVNLEFQFKKLCKDTPLIIDKRNTEEENDGNIRRRETDEHTGVAVNKTNVFYIAVGVVCSIILIIVTAVGFLHVHSMPKQTEESKHGLINNEVTDAVPAKPNVPEALKAAIAEKKQRELMHNLKDFIIRRNLLTLGNAVQEGSFGRAYIGTLINAESGEDMKVLVKTVTDNASPEQVTLFMMESGMLKRTAHHNVLPLMHLCFDETRPPLFIFPYLNRGNLKNYLRLSRTAEPLLKPLTTRDIVLMALQVARGLQYLARRRCIHKDVATRNCVVDEELHVKVSDNSLSRDFFPGDYHCLGDNENRPVRWMAVECLETNTYLIASDVWSYGVLLWELSSLSQTPYANVDPFEMLTYLKSGLRLPQPANCPDELFTVMACCWALSPEDRPQFTQIIACLEAFINKLNAFI